MTAARVRAAAEKENEKSLDMEFTLLADGHIVNKQVREFGGRRESHSAQANFERIRVGNLDDGELRQRLLLGIRF